MARVDYLRAVAKLAKRQGLKVPTVIVGFTQSYAIYVHENMEAHHPVGQAKFLEEPARTMGGQIGAAILGRIRAGFSLLDSFLFGGLMLQRAAQLLCPVKTGALRASAFTRALE